MSLLSIYNNGTLTGTSGPSAKRQREIVSAPTNLNSPTAGAFGDTYADAVLAAARNGKNNLVSMNTMVSNGSISRYTTDIFNQTSLRSNTLLKKANTNNLGPGRFNTDIIPYTERIFAEQSVGLGQAGLNQSILATATRAVPVLTPTSDTIGTVGGNPGDDGRYNITVGFGFVLYTTRGTYS